MHSYGGRPCLWLIFAVVATATSACAGGSEVPQEFLGRWHYMGSSGGIAGDGMGDAAEGYIVITAEGTIQRYQDDGTLLGETEFELERGMTIFSTEEQWILDPDEPMQRMIRVDGDRLTISENVYDGFSRHYARSR